MYEKLQHENMFSFAKTHSWITSNFRYAQNVNIQDMFTGCGVNQNTSKTSIDGRLYYDDEENGTIFEVPSTKIYRIEFIRIYHQFQRSLGMYQKIEVKKSGMGEQNREARYPSNLQKMVFGATKLPKSLKYKMSEKSYLTIF